MSSAIGSSLAPHPDPLPAHVARGKMVSPLSPRAGRGCGRSVWRPGERAPLPACGERVRVRGSLSAAGDGVNVADALRQSGLAPRLAAILGSEHLAKARNAVDLVGIARMHAD